MSQPIPGISGNKWHEASAGLRMSLCFRAGLRMSFGFLHKCRLSFRNLIRKPTENAQKRFGRGRNTLRKKFANVQKWSGKRLQKRSGRGSKTFRNGLGKAGKRSETVWERLQKRSEMVWETLDVRRSCLCAVDQEKAISHWKRTVSEPYPFLGIRNGQICPEFLLFCCRLRKGRF